MLAFISIEVYYFCHHGIFKIQKALKVCLFVDRYQWLTHSKIKNLKLLLRRGATSEEI